MWDGKRGQPYVGAIEVALTVPGAGDLVSRVPTTYFKSIAREASAPFVQKGTLRSGKGGKGGKVTSRKQAIAIGLSEARKKGAKVPKKNAART